MERHLLSSDNITHTRGGVGGGGGSVSDRDISTGPDVTGDFSMTNDLVRPRRRSLVLVTLDSTADGQVRANRKQEEKFHNKSQSENVGASQFKLR